eukprot:m51a1_g12803 hypothetical protein (151) ;mRNA; r:135-643
MTSSSSRNLTELPVCTSNETLFESTSETRPLLCTLRRPTKPSMPATVLTNCAVSNSCSFSASSSSSCACAAEPPGPAWGFFSFCVMGRCDGSCTKNRSSLRRFPNRSWNGITLEGCAGAASPPAPASPLSRSLLSSSGSTIGWSAFHAEK